MAHMFSHSMDPFIKQSIISAVTSAMMTAISLLQAKHEDNITSVNSLIEKMLVANTSSSSLTSPADTVPRPLLQIETSSKNER